LTHPFEYATLNTLNHLMSNLIDKKMKQAELILFNDSHFIIDMMYARKNNMVQQAVYEDIGYGNNAYMHPDVAEKLLSLVPILEKNSLKMRLCDAYRPPLAHKKLLQIIPFEGFFAKDPELSNHCHGTAVDVCLTDLAGQNLSYPTEIDAYEKHYALQVLKGDFKEFQQHLIKARHDYEDADKEQRKNRRFLKDLMENNGFESIPHEWWHYNIKNWQDYPLIEWQK